MDEQATEPQIKAILKLKLHDAPWQLTKQEAWKLMQEQAENPKVPVVRPGEVVKPKSANGHTAMYVSYVKDLIVAGKTPEEAFKIIQELRAKLN